MSWIDVTTRIYFDEDSGYTISKVQFDFERALEEELQYTFDVADKIVLSPDLLHED